MAVVSLGSAALSVLAACSGGFPAVMDPSDIASLREGTPRISRVRDLGSVHIGQAGPLLAESDGVITMGELVLVEGSGFGKQPTVQIAGHPAELRWRTAGGGIVVQVPLGSASGEQPLWVEAGGQRAQTQVTLQRLGVILDARRGAVHVVRVGGEAGPAPTAQTVGQPLKLPGAHALNYVRVNGAEDDTVILLDEVSGETFTVRPKIVINASGAWIDFTNRTLGRPTEFIGGTKGSHLVVDHKELHALTGDDMFHFVNTDGRLTIFYAIGDKVLIGTTDIRLDDPDTAVCDDDCELYSVPSAKILELFYQDRRFAFQIARSLSRYA